MKNNNEGVDCGKVWAGGGRSMKIIREEISTKTEVGPKNGKLGFSFSLIKK
jgi:hypothetical protein